jgi:hypothetical protein
MQSIKKNVIMEQIVIFNKLEDYKIKLKHNKHDKKKIDKKLYMIAAELNKSLGSKFRLLSFLV